MFTLRNVKGIISNLGSRPLSSVGSKLRPRPFHVIPIAFVIGAGVTRGYLFEEVSSDSSSPEDERTFKGKTWKTRFYRLLPWRTVSRVWGGVCSLNGPKWTCKSMVSWYVKTWGVDLSEAERENISDYANISDLFRRKLKPGARPIDPRSPVVSPCDGKVLVHGIVEGNGELEQVKGLNYQLFNFLGSPSWNKKAQMFLESAEKVKKADKKKQNVIIPSEIIKLKPESETALYYIVIYLAPGDYHRFHSPVNWRINYRRHIRGELLSVSPNVAEWVKGLFTINERVVYVGHWKYGFFSMTPVGATNVGSIRVYGDEELATNKRKHDKTKIEKFFTENYRCKKGMDFGEFNLGSTIVLIFEMPKQYKFTVGKGDKVKMGQALCSTSMNSSSNSKF